MLFTSNLLNLFVQDTITQPIGLEIMEARRWNKEEMLHVSEREQPCKKACHKLAQTPTFVKEKFLSCSQLK